MTVCTMRVLRVWQFVPFEELIVSVCVSVQMLWRGERQGLERIQQQVSNWEFLRQGGGHNFTLCTIPPPSLSPSLGPLCMVSKIPLPKLIQRVKI